MPLARPDTSHVYLFYLFHLFHSSNMGLYIHIHNLYTYFFIKSYHFVFPFFLPPFLLSFLVLPSPRPRPFRLPFLPSFLYYYFFFSIGSMLPSTLIQFAFIRTGYILTNIYKDRLRIQYISMFFYSYMCFFDCSFVWFEHVDCLHVCLVCFLFCCLLTCLRLVASIWLQFRCCLPNIVLCSTTGRSY